MRLRSKFAVKCAKFTSRLIKKMGKGQGAAFPGLVARIIDPRILSSMASMIKGKSVAVMGTNGKTTTNALICKALCAEGYKVITNATGANMYNGIVSAFVLATDGYARLDADFACIEVDEMAAAKVLPHLRPDCVVLTNISADQADRLGDENMTADAIKSSFDKVPGAVLILNADTPVCRALGCECKNPSVTFGINGAAFKNISRSAVEEGGFCPLCGSKLHYEYRHYGVLGDYRCPGCGFCRPAPDFTAEDIVFDGKSFKFTLMPDMIHSCVETAYSIYNTLAAYSAILALGVRPHKFGETVGSFDFGNNRENIYTINGKTFKLHLAKNPEGFRQKISLILNDKALKDIVIVINDYPADGEDISWIWNVDFQYLRDANASSIVAAGTRYCETGLRFKYEDMPCTTAKDLKGALLNLLKGGTDNIYVVVNYSGLMPANNILKAIRKEAKGAAEK